MPPLHFDRNVCLCVAVMGDRLHLSAISASLGGAALAVTTRSMHELAHATEPIASGMMVGGMPISIKILAVPRLKLPAKIKQADRAPIKISVDLRPSMYVVIAPKSHEDRKEEAKTHATWKIGIVEKTTIPSPENSMEQISVARITGRRLRKKKGEVKM